MQILFSTHSPSLIDIQHLERIRCIVKNKTVGSKIMSKVTDAVDNETLMPLATAVGVNTPEKLRTLLAGERSQTTYSAATSPSPTEESVNQSVQAPSPSAVSQAAVEQPRRTEPLPREKAVQGDDVEEEELETTPSRKPLFKLFGR